MSLWKRIQRVGKKAAKFQFTASLEEISIVPKKNHKPKSVLVVLTRRGRRCTSRCITLEPPTNQSFAYASIWSTPENLEIITTLYQNEKDITFEDKEWTFQIEDVGMSTEAFQNTPLSATTRRRVLATCLVNVSEFASALPTQNILKLSLRPATTKISSAVLILTLHGLMLKTGEATDEDMISLASMMSLSRVGSFNTGSQFSISQDRFLQNQSSDFPLLNNHAETTAGVTIKLNTPDQHQPNEVIQDSEFDESVEDRYFATSNLTLDRLTNSRTNQKQSDCKKNESLLQSTITSSSINTSPSFQTDQDLLTWCQEITVGYSNVSVTDISTSFRSGLAFCAILHHFHPELIDFDRLSVNDPIGNLRLAFEVAAKLGIPRVLDPSEINSPHGLPDRLSMLTYLHQLRTHFTQQDSLPIKNESVAIENDQPNNIPIPPLLSENNVDKKNRNQNSLSLGQSDSMALNVKSSVSYQEKLAKARTLLQECLSRPQVNDHNDNVFAPGSIENSINKSSAATTAGLKIRRLKLTNLKLFSDVFEHSKKQNLQTNTNDQLPDCLGSGIDFSDSNMYTQLLREQAAVASQQTDLDHEAPKLEKRLRDVMKLGHAGGAEEELLMRQWFSLINKKNALLHRSYQLSIMEKEIHLQNSIEKTKAELRKLMSKEEGLITDEEKEREDFLLHEIINMVNERDDIIQELHLQEQASVDEFNRGLQTDEITREVFNKENKTCIVQ